MQKTLQINLIRRDGKINVFIQVPKEIENFFKNLADEQTKKSKAWLDGQTGDGREFYQRDADSTINKKLDDFLQKNDAYNDFGDGLLHNEMINIAPLRVVNATNGIELQSVNFENISNIDFEFYIRRLAEVTKQIWSAFISSREIRATIQYEL